MDKMREEFEAWFKCEFGYTPARSELNMDDYSTTASSTSWLAWKASRAALCVELPEREVAGKYADDFEDGHESGFNDALSDCKFALKKAGVSYK